ncbi:hypothetical protein [Vibrio sp. AND4]|uniref:hypothetical protein n=1 Tax=Vibrio sp. AND4 TaxID=314289 RepID=UPI0002DB0A38|nr:hypothetical protein [Vibrio sp. AND4]
MKKFAIALTSVFAGSVFAGSYQLGTITEFVAEKDRVTFQLNTDYGEDIRAEGCDGEKLNFSIDLTNLGAQYMFNLVKYARENMLHIGVNGDGYCWGNGEFENADSIAVREPLT